MEGGVVPTRSQAAREQDLHSRLEGLRVLEDQLGVLEDQLWVLEDQLRVLEDEDKRPSLLQAPNPRSPPKLLRPASTTRGLPKALLPAVPGRCSLGPCVARVNFTAFGGIGGPPDWLATLP